MHDERNFLRAAPFSPLALASFEHWREADDRGFAGAAAFLAAFAGAAFAGAAFAGAALAVAADLAGAAPCANAVPKDRASARAAADRVVFIFIVGLIPVEGFIPPAGTAAQPKRPIAHGEIAIAPHFMQLSIAKFA